MSTVTSTPSQATPLIPAENAVRAQFGNPPSLESVTRQMLAAAIAQQYPSLHIDLDRARLAVPFPHGGWALQPLMTRVTGYLGTGAELNLSPVNGQAYHLTDNAPDWLAHKEGELDMKVIERLIKELSWRLPIGLQNALTDLWGQDSGSGGNRWQWLSDVFKDTLSISALQQPDLTDAAREALYQVINCPERAERIHEYGDGAVRAYWLKSTLLSAGQTYSRLNSSIVFASADQVLEYTPGSTSRLFKNMDALSQSWSDRVRQLYSVEEIHLERFELDGNAFDACAAAILNQQLADLSLLKLPASIGWRALQAVYLKITETASFFANAPVARAETLIALKKQLPDWLTSASTTDQALYRQYSLALSGAKKINKGRTHLSGLPDIHSFTADVLHQQMQLDQRRFEQGTPVHASRETFHPDDIELTFHTATGLPGAVGIVEYITMSLTDLAVKNLLGRPKGSVTLRHRLGLKLPTWLTPEYITRRGGLIERANIGKAYPGLLESTLLGTTADARAREKLFARHTRAQLPLEALEYALKQENGVTALGARYVAAVVQPGAAGRKVNDTAVVIRHLALVRQPEAAADIVHNMYIIEPADIEVGPHLLYRPLYTPSLLQFPDRAALLAAIAEPGSLQNSLLTWLDDIARPIYENGGIKQPHYVRFGLGSEFAPLEIPPPAQLATNGISNELLQYLNNGQLMQFLYGSNTRALVALADAESVSNRESRWGALLEGANLVFNTLLLLPGLPHPLMLTGGLLTLVNAARQDIPALASDDSATRELAAADVLLNVGMLLFHQAINTLPRPHALPEHVLPLALKPFAPPRFAEQWPEPPAPTMHSGTVALAGEFPSSESTTLDFSFFSARNHLTPSQKQGLAYFKVTPPDTLPAVQPTGLHKGQYRFDQRWHVLIDQTLYPVDMEPDGAAVIVSASDATRQGPALKSDADGNWSLDLRLRLLGGMPPRRIAEYQQRKTDRIKQLEDELQAFFKQEEPLHKAVDITQSALTHAKNDPRFTPEQVSALGEKFETTLQKQLNAYQQLLESNKERIELQIPFHERIVISLLQKLFDNLIKFLARSANEQVALLKKWPQFSRPGLELERAGDADPEGFMQFIRAEIAHNERTIQRLELRNTYIDQLYNLSPAGAEAAERMTSILSRDEHTSLTLKAFQLDCLKLASSKTSAGILIEDSLDYVIDPLKEHLHTHNELNTLEFDANKRMEVLDSLVQHYGQALDALQGIGMLHAADLELDYFNKLRQQLEELYQDVTVQLAAEIKPPAKPGKRARRRRPSSASKTQKKVIHVRGKGQLIGEVKAPGKEWPIEVIEVRSDYDNQLLSTYSQHGEEWVEIQTPVPPVPIERRALNVIKGEGRRLFDKVEEHLDKARQYKAQCRHPEEIEEILSLQASKLDKLATELHFALQAQPPAARLANDQILINNLRSAYRLLRSEGQKLRTQLSLELPPTHGNLQYLLDLRRVQIARLGKRIQLQGERRDFIQEYAINDCQGAPLWYAHFHYSAADTPSRDYAVAHLKTRAQRKLSYYSQLTEAQSGQAIVNVHRGQIGRALAEHWFLPLTDDAK